MIQWKMEVFADALLILVLSRKLLELGFQPFVIYLWRMDYATKLINIVQRVSEMRETVWKHAC